MITMDDKYRFEDFGFICEPGNEDPLTPNMERKTVSIPGRVGTWDFGVEIGEKPFSFQLKIIDRFYTNMQRMYDEFVDFLLDPFGQPREIKIEFDYAPGKYHLVKVNGPIVPGRSQDDENIFTVNLIASDPLKYGNAESHEIHWDSETVTFDDSYSMDTVYVDDVLITSSKTVETTVNGYALSPLILINGSGQNVTLSANGKTMSLGNFTNSTFEINGKNFSITKNGLEVFIDGDFLILLPGLNRVQIAGNNLNFNLSIRVRDQYI